MTAYIALWRVIFLLALILELPIVVFGALVGNAITHPLLWFGWPRILSGAPLLLAGEEQGRARQDARPAEPQKRVRDRVAHERAEHDDRELENEREKEDDPPECDVGGHAIRPDASRAISRAAAGCKGRGWRSR